MEDLPIGHEDRKVVIRRTRPMRAYPPFRVLQNAEIGDITDALMAGISILEQK
jgi:hypothetical protein